MKRDYKTIYYTKTDEAPFLATCSLLPIIKSFLSQANVKIELKDISLAARIISSFPDYLKKDQIISNDLKSLGKLVKDPNSNIIKLPNISASIPQLISAIKELQAKGFNVPNYPKCPKNEQEREIKERYDLIKGSAVNPVLREGNSDRRAPESVKNYAKLNPHYMGKWSSSSKTHISTMSEGDFFRNEKSICNSINRNVRIELHCKDGKLIVLKEKIHLLQDEIVDVSFMSKRKLLSFIEKEINDVKKLGILFSLHMKATMMKVSDPIIFGYFVEIYFKDLLLKHKKTFDSLGVDYRNGFSDVITKIADLSKKERNLIHNDIKNFLKENSNIAMVDSDNNITNLHVPSDVIIDASMPAMIRNSGKMWDSFGKTADTKAVIPDSTYASVYSATIEFCKQNGSFDPVTMGTVPNVGLMAQKAEEYGSHDKTFEISNDGKVKVIDDKNNVLFEHDVDKGDIWRMCQTKDAAIKDWVRLAFDRVEKTGWPAVFWLDNKRAHDIQIINKVNSYLKDYGGFKNDITIMSPYKATLYTLDRLKRGKNTISVTGNVLRDYLTDLFPILELGTSAKMLSIVPLMKGGGLFETGAGGSAPKHVQQMIKEGHLRWDSLGEFSALVASLEYFAEKHQNRKADILSQTLNLAIEELLKNDKSPKRKVGELDNRGSHFYLAMYWSKFLSLQTRDKSLKNIFTNVYTKLSSSEEKIINEINLKQGEKYDIKGYYYPDQILLNDIMRPSKIFNLIIDSL